MQAGAEHVSNLIYDIVKLPHNLVTNTMRTTTAAAAAAAAAMK